MKTKVFFFTFGQSHRHKVGKFIYDKDCVVSVQADSEQAARARFISVFGTKWAFCYSGMNDVALSYYPRGVVDFPDWAVKAPQFEHDINDGKYCQCDKCRAK